MRAPKSVVDIADLVAEETGVTNCCPPSPPPIPWDATQPDRRFARLTPPARGSGRFPRKQVDSAASDLNPVGDGVLGGRRVFYGTGFQAESGRVQRTFDVAPCDPPLGQVGPFVGACVIQRPHAAIFVAQQGNVVIGVGDRPLDDNACPDLMSSSRATRIPWLISALQPFSRAIHFPVRAAETP